MSEIENYVEDEGLFIVGRKLQSDSTYLIPSEIIIKGKIQQISIASTHSLFLNSEGIVYCLGSNRYGQLGLGHTSDINSVTPVLFSDKIIFIATGYYNSGFISEKGNLYTMGWANGLGFNSLKNVSTPNKVRILDEANHFSTLNIGWEKISFGDKFCIGIVRALDDSSVALDGDVFIFGDNSFLLTDAICPLNITRLFEDDFQKKKLNNSTFKKVIQVSAGTSHILALTNKNEVYSWGNGEDGALGHGDFNHRSTPQKIVELENYNVKFLKAIASMRSSTFVDINFNIYTCGLASVLGQGYNENLNRPTKIKWFHDNDVTLKAISCGDKHSIALSTNFQIFAWGDGAWGKLLNKKETDLILPTKIDYPMKVREFFLGGGNVSYFIQSKESNVDYNHKVSKNKSPSLRNIMHIKEEEIKGKQEGFFHNNNSENKLEDVRKTHQTVTVIDLSNTGSKGGTKMNKSKLEDYMSKLYSLDVSKANGKNKNNILIRKSSIKKVNSNNNQTIEYASLPWKCKCNFTNTLLLNVCGSCGIQNLKKENPLNFATSNFDSCPSKEGYYLQLMRNYKIKEKEKKIFTYIPNKYNKHRIQTSNNQANFINLLPQNKNKILPSPVKK